MHTVVMAAYGILEDLAKGNFFYEAGLKPHLTKIGRTRLRAEEKRSWSSSGGIVLPLF